MIQWYRLHHYCHLFPKLFNSLFLFQRADKQLSILLGYYIAIQALNHHLAFIGCMNHAVLAFIQTDILTHLGIASIMDEMAPSFYTEQEKEVVGKLFPTCEKISIDYAVMEKSKEIYTLPAEFGWSDLGSWGSLRTLLPQDEAGNAKVGKDIRLYECKNCVVHAAYESKVVVHGLDGYIVAEKNGQLLVCSLKEEQRIQEFGK